MAEEARKSTAKLTREYLESRPALRAITLQGLVNYSALARRMIEETGKGNEEAVIVALRRYVREMEGERALLPDDEVGRLLSESSISTRTGVCRMTVKNDWSIMARLEPVFKRLLTAKMLLQIILGTEGITIITERKAFNDIMGMVEKDAVMGAKEGLAEVAVVCPETIEDIRGVVAHLATMLAMNAVNVVEMVSCYTDVIFIVEEDDTMTTYEILKRLIG